MLSLFLGTMVLFYDPQPSQISRYRCPSRPQVPTTRIAVFDRHSNLVKTDGATPAVVQRQLRHRDPRITLGVYGHVVGDQRRDAVENRSARTAKFAVN